MTLKREIPTVHLGPAASQMERRGIRTELGDRNREIAVTNKQIRQLRARISHLEKWLAEEAANPVQPTLADVLDEVMSRQGQSALTRLRNGAEIFNFLNTNEVYSMEDLEKKVNAMQGKLNSTSTEMKKAERRIDTLKEHIRHSEHFKEHRKLRRQYDRLYSEYTAARNETGLFAERKAKKALEAVNDFREFNHTGLTLFDAAERYLRDVLQERYDPKKLPPISKWRDELSAKTAEMDALNREYHKLKEETQKVEKIQRSVKEILHSDSTARTYRKPLGMNL